MPQVHFIPQDPDIGCPFPSCEMIPPQIGATLFLEGKDKGWSVEDVQYVFKYAGRSAMFSHVNVLLVPEPGNGRQPQVNAG